MDEHGDPETAFIDDVHMQFHNFRCGANYLAERLRRLLFGFGIVRQLLAGEGLNRALP